MQIAVTFRHMDTSEGIKDYVQEKVERLQKYIENPREVHVVLSAEKFLHRAEITIVADGSTLNSQGKDSDLHTAVDQMVEKMERQIRERRGKERRKRSGALPSKAGVAGEANPAEEGEETEGLGFIQKRRVIAKPMSLEEAAAQLNVSERNMVVFINSESGQVNVLSRLEGEGYEWIEPVPK
jgi:putative sigma-54 modulation protein